MKNYKNLATEPSLKSTLKRLTILIGFIILPVVILIQISSLFVQLIIQRLMKAKTSKTFGKLLDKEDINDIY